MTTSRTPDVVSGLTTDWIPLTTPGPGSISECSTAIYYLPGAVSAFVAFDPYYGKWIDTAVKCLATEQSLWWDQHSDGGINDINLGPFACPSGYTTASVSTVNAQTSFVGCCPSYVAQFLHFHKLANNQSAYTFLGSFLGAATLGQCHSPLSVGQTIVGKSTDTASGDWQDTTAVLISTGASVVAVHVNGFVFQAGVVSTAPGSASASTTQGGSTPTTSSVVASNTAPGTSASSSPTTASITPSTGLSSGAKIGIGVGVSLGFVGICCMITTIIMLKRRSRPHNSIHPAGLAEAPSYLPSYPIAKRAGGSRSIYEVPGKSEERRTMAENYYQSPTDTDGVPGESRQDKKGPVEMWVSPSQGG